MPWEGRQAPPDTPERIHVEINISGMHIGKAGKEFFSARGTRVGNLGKQDLAVSQVGLSPLLVRTCVLSDSQKTLRRNSRS